MCNGCNRREPNPGDTSGHPIDSPGAATRLAIFQSLAASDANRGSLDQLYSVLTDAIPVGPSRCRRTGPLRAKCPCCILTCGTYQTETTRHTHLECPTSTLLLDTLHRAVSHCAGSNITERRRTASLTPEALVQEHRLQLVTGYASNSRMHAGGNNAPDPKPWSALIAETHRVLEGRRRRNDAEGGVNAQQMHTRTDVQGMYTKIMSAMRVHVRNTKRMADEREDELVIMYPDKDFEQEGPRAKWRATWVNTGWADKAGRLLLPLRASQPKGSRALIGATPWAWNTQPALTVVHRWLASQCQPVLDQAPGMPPVLKAPNAVDRHERSRTNSYVVPNPPGSRESLVATTIASGL